MSRVVQSPDGAEPGAEPGVGSGANGAANGEASDAVGGVGSRPAAFDRAKTAMQPCIDAFGEADPEWDRHTVIAKAREVAAECGVSKRDLCGWVGDECKKLTVGGDDSSANSSRHVAAGAVNPVNDLQDVEPDAAPKSLDWVAAAMEGLIERRISCSDEVRTAVVLWSIGTWGLFPPTDPDGGPDIFPRLHIFSPVKRCGKSLLLEIVLHFVRRGLFATDVTEASIFRAIKAWRPAIVIDEADQLFRKNPAFVSIANSGYARTGNVIRTVEVQQKGRRDWLPEMFSTFAALALAGIGRIPGTIADRSIRVGMQRQSTAHRRARVSLRQLRNMRGKLGPMLMAHADAVGAAMAAGVAGGIIPSTLGDRDADNWRPLLGLAHLLGGDWPARTRHAAVALCLEPTDGDRGGEWALQQIVEFVDERRRDAVEQWFQWVRAGRPAVPRLGPHPRVSRPARLDFVVSDDLAGWLWAKDDSGFSDARSVQAVKGRVWRLLRNFGVKPGQRRVDGLPKRGYPVAGIRHVWRRYR
jgi:hypothetical protein